MSTEAEKFEFYSRGRGLVVGIESPKVHYDQDGRRVESGGVVADFSLENGTFTTTDPEVAEHLRGCESFGTDFFESGAEDSAVTGVADAFAELAGHTAAHDAEAIETLLQNEKATHNRPEVVGAAEAALSNVRKVLDVGVARTEPEVEAPEVASDPGARPAETTEAEAAAAEAAPEGGEGEPENPEAPAAEGSEPPAEAPQE